MSMPESEPITLEDTEDAFDRIQRAIKRGTGCYLTPRMVAGLSISFLGEIAAQPRVSPTRKSRP
jgi:hypothetical protein